MTGLFLRIQQQLKTDAEYTAEEEEQARIAREEEIRRELAEAKALAKGELAEYKDPSDYREAEKALMEGILADAEKAIDAAKDKAEVAVLNDEYRGKLDALKTDADYTAEEEAERRRQGEEAAKEALLSAKKEAVKALLLYVVPSDYREAEQEQIFAIRTETETKINNALSEKEVEAALSDALVKLDKLKTDEDYKAEEEQRKKEEEEERKAREKTAVIEKARAARTSIKAKALSGHKTKITWKKVTLSYFMDGMKYTRAVTGYKIYRAAKKNGKYKVVKTLKKAGKVKYTDKKLKAGRKYFYKVRTYTVIDGETYLGKWSKAKSIKAK